MEDDNVVTISIFILAILMFGLVLFVGLERVDKARCLELKGFSEEYEGFYLTRTQKEMCDTVGVKIEAPVK